MNGFKTFIKKISPTCKDASLLQSQAMDHNLSFAEKTGLRLHLMICKWCRRYGSQIKFLHAAAPNLQDPEVTEPEHRLSAEAQERIKRALQAKQD